VAERSTRETPARQHTAAPIAPPEPPEVLSLEFAALPAFQRLYESGDCVVAVASAAQMPRLMSEIGRLREFSFRAVGEGTGRACDRDAYDDWYQQLFVWDHRRCQVLGAYRLTLTDVTVRQRGLRGLYTHSLFVYDEALLDEFGPALELGRSFVRPECQGTGRVLALLWRGIGQLLAARPRYRTLFGPVSISAAYSEESRQLIASRLCQGRYRHPLSAAVDARHPVQSSRLDIAALDEEFRALSRRVGAIERDQKGLPVLVREYLKLGGQFLSFSVDPEFLDAMDGLVAIHLDRTSPRLLQLYMGAENYAAFRRARPPAPPAEVRVESA
jgi:putative hemolysin